MTIKTGVDIAVVAEDLATPTLQRVGAGIERLESTAESVGGKVSDRLGEGLIGGLSAALAGTALDAALEHAVESAKAGDVGFELGVSMANAIGDGLRSVPIAGPLGEIGAIYAEPFAEGFVDLLLQSMRSLPLPDTFDAILAGTQSTGEQGRLQEAAQREGDLRIKIAEQISRLERQLGDDLLTDLEKRRQTLEDAASGILRQLHGLDAETARAERDRVRRIIEERLARDEERRRESEAAKQRADEERRLDQERRDRARELEAEQRRLDQERREREREEELASKERERVARAIRDAESRTPGALESRSLQGRAAAFVASRGQDAAQLAATRQQTGLLRELRDWLRRISEKQSVTVDFP